MHYFITGHTGFKGSWLALWLHENGHQISGYSLDPEPESLFERAQLSDIMEHDYRSDIRDAAVLGASIEQAQPDVVVHMAAQPLVRESFRDPRSTIEVNVLGTMNVLEAVSRVPSVQAQVIVTTDKVYRNVGQVAGYVEDDALGGADPYSASKAMADLLTHAWASSFDLPPTAVVRAGNVIGGGDISKDRLLPDLLDAVSAGAAPEIRYPSAVRPWQHVLDCLAGYRTLIDHMLQFDAPQQDWGAWNFGPDEESIVTVGDIASRVAKLWQASSEWNQTVPEFNEASLLVLDSSKARSELGWRSRLTLDQALLKTVDWEKRVRDGADALEVTVAQIDWYSQLLSE